MRKLVKIGMVQAAISWTILPLGIIFPQYSLYCGLALAANTAVYFTLFYVMRGKKKV